RGGVGGDRGGGAKRVVAGGGGGGEGWVCGNTSKAALMTRGRPEATRRGVARGGDPATFLGLSGVGDLIATGASRLSRNYRVGFGLGQGHALPDILADLGQVAEGIPTTRVLCDLAARSQVETPLCSALYAVLYEGRAA